MSASNVHNPCATCGICCRSYVVPLCGYDVWLIATRQRLSPEQFLVACPQETPGWDGFRLERDGPAYGLALDKRGRFRPRAPCIFLLELAGGHSRCGIYPHRPVVCASYPAALVAQRVAERQDALCPPDSWPEAALARPAWRASLQRLRMQYDLYYEAVTRWNARVATLPAGQHRPLHEYYSYVINVYDRLAALGEELGEEALQRVTAAWPHDWLPREEGGNVAVRQGEHPWFDYLVQARAVIDSYYPHLPPAPLTTVARALATDG